MADKKSKKMPMSEHMDNMKDRKSGIKDGSKKDSALDKKRGLPADKMKAKKK